MEIIIDSTNVFKYINKGVLDCKSIIDRIDINSRTTITFKNLELDKTSLNIHDIDNDNIKLFIIDCKFSKLDVLNTNLKDF